jgi:hypothetical protein
MTTIATEVSDPLAALARSWSDRDFTERTERLTSLVAGSWPDVPQVALMDAFADYLSAVLTADDLEAGMAEWRDFGATWEDAWLNVCGEVDAALKTLVNGPRRGAEGTGN